MTIRSRIEYQARKAATTARLSTVTDAQRQCLGLSDAKLAQLMRAFAGKLVLQDSPEYEADRVAGSIVPDLARPLLMGYCTTYGDIALLIDVAQELRVELTCRSGGHNTAGWQVSSGVVADLSAFDNVTVDRKSMTITVGAGALWGKVNSIMKQYRVHTVTGGCPSVGVAGYLQGGGFGFTSRTFGAGCDQIVEATVMLANKQIVIASTSENPDLFFAIRGGTGQNFGIVLEFTLRLYEGHDMWGFCLQWDINEGPAVLHTQQALYAASPIRSPLGLQTVFAMLNGQCVILGLGIYNGPRADGLQTIAPMLAVGHPKLVADEVAPYADLDLIDSILPGPPAPQHGGKVYEIKDGWYLDRVLSEAEWQSICDYYETTPNPWNIVDCEIYGGALASYPTGTNAFVHRNQQISFFVDSFWEEPWDYNNETEARSWLNGFIALVKPFSSGHKYQNYPSPDYADYRWAYFGDAYNTLLFVKQKYDPTDFFRFPQAITPYPDEPSIHRSTMPSFFSDSTIQYPHW